jgi:uncharacterized protein (TIGR00162 family)
VEEIDITFHSEDEIKADIMIEGLPGIGQVGKLVAEHMIRELDARKIAEIRSIYFPPQVIVEANGIARLASNQIYRYEGATRIAFLVGDYQSVSNEGHYLLCERYLDIAEHLGVSRIYTLGGYGVGHLVDEPRVLSAVNQEALRPMVEAAGGTFNRDEPVGGIVGAAGLMLGLGVERGIEGICLMGETSGYLVDPKSAHALLSVLCRLLAMEIDPRSLHDRAVEMEQVIEKLKEVERDKHNEELNYIG